MAITIGATRVPQPVEGVAARLGGRNHIERNRKCTAVVYVIHPQLGSGELPFYITVTLGTEIVYYLYVLLHLFRVKINSLNTVANERMHGF